MALQYMIAALDRGSVTDEGNGSFDTLEDAEKVVDMMLDIDSDISPADRTPQHVLSIYSIDTETGEVKTVRNRAWMEKQLANADREHEDAERYGREGTAKAHGVSQSDFV